MDSTLKLIRSTDRKRAWNKDSFREFFCDIFTAKKTCDKEPVEVVNSGIIKDDAYTSNAKSIYPPQDCKLSEPGWEVEKPTSPTDKQPYIQIDFPHGSGSTPTLNQLIIDGDVSSIEIEVQSTKNGPFKSIGVFSTIDMIKFEGNDIADAFAIRLVPKETFDPLDTTYYFNLALWAACVGKLI